jgi:cytochrome c-type biogenesis protein CcmH
MPKQILELIHRGAMKSRYTSFLIFQLLILLLLFMTGVVVAQDDQPVSDDEVNEIARELYCPICENVPLDVCPTQACADWRELIREYLAQGWTKDEIKTYFASQYGWNVLAEPPRTGLNWVIYSVPPLVIGVGLSFILLLMYKSRRNRQTTPTLGEEIDSKISDAELNRIDRDLRKADRDE